MEQAGSMEAYHEGANSFGANIRSLTAGRENDWAETVLREAAASRKSLSDAIVPPRSAASDIARRTASMTDADEVGYAAADQKGSGFWHRTRAHCCGD